jgi:hypothetical protein
MRQFKVTVNVELVENSTPGDAEMDDDVLGEHVYWIDTCCDLQAEKLALEQFHGFWAIGCLDYVEITSKVEKIS